MGGGFATEGVPLRVRLAGLPANLSPSPLHPSAQVDEHSVGHCVVSDEDSLEGASDRLTNTHSRKTTMILLYDTHNKLSQTLLCSRENRTHDKLNGTRAPNGV